MKIAVMSDSHDDWNSLENAIILANEKWCEKLLFAWDLIAVNSWLRVLEKFNWECFVILWDNDSNLVKRTRVYDAHDSVNLAWTNWLRYEWEIWGASFFINHFERISEIAAHSWLYDFCITWDEHTYRESRIWETILLNPWSVKPNRSNESTFAIIDTITKNIEKIDL